MLNRITVPTIEYEWKERCEAKFSTFIKRSFHVLEPGRQFINNWHLGCMAEHLQAVSELEIKKLIINIPIRRSKSLVGSVMWFGWDWARNPEHRWINSSYAQRLSTRDNLKCRDLVTSDWYQALWGDKFVLRHDQNVKTYFVNNQAGYRMATFTGTGLGFGGDYIVTDDPLDRRHAKSAAHRQNCIDWWTQTMARRVEDPARTRLVIIMQRLHERDLTGYLMAEELGYETLILPEHYAPKRIVEMRPAKKEDLPKNPIVLTVLQRQGRAVDPRTEEGEHLWPERFSPEYVKEEERELTAQGASGQLEQAPSPAEGDIFKDADFCYCTETTRDGVVYFDLEMKEDKIVSIPVQRCRFFQCIDTALETEATSKYTAVVTFAIAPHFVRQRTKRGGEEWKLHKRYLIVYDAWHGKLEVGEQYLAIDELRDGKAEFDFATREWVVNGCAVPWPKMLAFSSVEKKASGHGLIQQAAAEGRPLGVLTASRDKVERSATLSSLYKQHLVFHMRGMRGRTAYEGELLDFPSGAFNDFVDCGSYGGLEYVKNKLLSRGLDRELVYEIEGGREEEYVSPRDKLVNELMDSDF